MPRIVAPVSRHLDVADVPRTIAYYRDVLGFAVVNAGDAASPAELTSGPARITLGTRNGHGSGSRHVLFFEVDDTSAMQAALASRGANPSEAEDVNWIKMRVFEVRDASGDIGGAGT